MSESEAIAFHLTDDERALILHGLNQYFVSAERAVPLLCPILGVIGYDEFGALARRLYEAIRERAPLSELDWARAVVLTEISWASDLVGAASAFATIVPDEVAIQLLRDIQREVMFPGRYKKLENNATVVGRTKWTLPLINAVHPEDDPSSSVASAGEVVAIDLRTTSACSCFMR